MKSVEVGSLTALYAGLSFGAILMVGTEWENKVKGLLKGELKRRNISYFQLVEKLAIVGVIDSEPNVRNKLSRGKFTAVFFVQCLEAIGTTSLKLSLE